MRTVKLYGMGSPNVQKVILLLEELELPYEFVWVDVFRGEQWGDEFLAINPNSKVPALIDCEADGLAVTVWESGSILIYLAEKAARFLPTEGPERYAVLQWLMLQMSGVGPTCGQALHFKFLADGAGYAQARFLTEAQRLMAVLAARLASSRFLAGSDYSIADISMFPWIRLMRERLPDLVHQAPLQAWCDGLEGRPAVRRMVAMIEGLKRRGAESRKTAAPAMLDRYYGRVSPTSAMRK